MSEDLVVTRDTCRICGKADLTPILSLGDLYVSDFLGESDADRAFKAPLELMLCNVKNGGCGLLQLRHTVSHEAMYRNYWYRSGINRTMTDELTGIAHAMESMVNFKAGDYAVDIGANDGTLLRAYTKKDIERIGYEPARNLGQYNSVGTTRVFNDFFNAAAFEKEFPGKKAKVVTAIAMFYDLEDPNAFVADIKKILDDDGVFVVQQSYLPLMLATNEIGNICHEHVEYYALLSMENLLARHGLEIFDVMTNDINGGSFRTYIRYMGRGKNIKVAKDAALRVSEMRDAEREMGLATTEPYRKFVESVHEIRDQLKQFIMEAARNGKKIYGYGASTKGNTLLQYFKIGPEHITAIAERNPDKWGKKTVGSAIPIISEEDVRKVQPDYLVVLPWHFLREFLAREQEFLERGGKFVVPMPQFRVVGNGDEV